MKNIVDFIFYILKVIVGISAICSLTCLVLLVLAVIMPDNFAAAMDIVKGLLS